MFANRRAVLHVDDDPLMTDLVGEHLRQAGYESEGANDPLGAMQALQRGQYRIVVLDVDMPDLSGLHLLQRIKRHDAGIQVIMLTALVNESTVIDAIRHGAEACFFKPLTDPAPFIDAIDDAFRRNDRFWQTLRELSHRRRSGEECSSCRPTPAQLLQPA